MYTFPPPVLTNSLDSSPSILASLSSRFQVPAEVPSNPHIERFHNAQDKNRIAKAIYVLSTPSSLFSRLRVPVKVFSSPHVSRLRNAQDENESAKAICVDALLMGPRVCYVNRFVTYDFSAF